MNFEKYPFLVAWEVTNACDLACRHCRASAQPCPLPGELSTREGLALIDELATFDPHPLLLITGGDPLKRADLFDLIRHATERGVKVGLTPATTPLLTRSAVERARAAGVSRLAVSIDAANAESHDAFRGEPGSFERALQALEWAWEIDLPTQVNTTVTRTNVADLPQLADLLNKSGIVLWSVFFLVPVGRGQLLEQLSAPQYEDILHWLYEVSLTSRFHVKTTEAHHFRRVVAQHRAKQRQEGDRALAAGESLHPFFGGRAPTKAVGTSDGNGFVFISATGDVTPSGFFPLPAGNVRERALADIYQNTPLFQQLRNKDLLEGKCGRCEFRGVCGGSRARAYAESGNPLAPDSRCSYVPPLPARAPR